VTAQTDPSRRLRDAFVDALGLPPDAEVEQLAYRSVPEWDSVAHMQLVNAIERAFDVMLDTSDVLGLSSWEHAREILSRHGVTLDARG
jgi:acyl carrier protein